MAYKKRLDNRKFDEMRPREIKVGVLKNADGSAIFSQGKTKVLAAVYGPKTLHPQRLRNIEKGLLRVYYRMLPFSVDERKSPKPNRRDIELSLVIKEALESAVFLEEFPSSVVDVYVYVLQSDAGTRCAAICAASLALADAGVPMRDLVSAVSAGVINGQPVLDLTAEEEHLEGEVTDMPIAFVENSNKISLLQMDGKTNQENLLKALKLGVEACKQLKKEMVQALRLSYLSEGD